MTCYIINTSPRPQANCKVLAERLAEKVPGSVLVDFKSSRINYCQGCNACKAKEEPWCVQGDDWAALIPQLDACDSLAVLSPIYFDDVTAQAKTVEDRLYAWFNPAKEHASISKKFGKKIAVVVTNGGGPKDQAEQRAAKFASAFAVAGFSESKVLALPGLNVPACVLENREYLAQADEIAEWLNA